MLTRSAVAKRLRKSLATVRRLEGNRLYPTVDRQGVHRFSEQEVSALVRQLANERRLPEAQGAWLKQTGKSSTPRLNRTRVEHTQSTERVMRRAKQEVAQEILDYCEGRDSVLDEPLIDYLENLLVDS